MNRLIYVFYITLKNLKAINAHYAMLPNKLWGQWHRSWHNLLMIVIRSVMVWLHCAQNFKAEKTDQELPPQRCEVMQRYKKTQNFFLKRVLESLQ